MLKLKENLKEQLVVDWSLLALCTRSALSCKPDTTWFNHFQNEDDRDDDCLIKEL